MKSKLIIPIILLGLPTIYFLLNPLMFDFPHFLRPRKITNISMARDYYSVISSIVTILFGSIGLTLGWFYYYDKKKFDLSAQERDRKRAHIHLFLDKFDSYDRLVRRILHQNIINQHELDVIRADILFTFDIAQSMLSQETSLLGLNKEDFGYIVKVFSFVEKSETIMHAPLEKLSKVPLDSIRYTYFGLISNAREKCYAKIV